MCITIGDYVVSVNGTAGDSAAMVAELEADAEARVHSKNLKSSKCSSTSNSTINSTINDYNNTSTTTTTTTNHNDTNTNNKSRLDRPRSESTIILSVGFVRLSQRGRSPRARRAQLRSGTDPIRPNSDKQTHIRVGIVYDCMV